MDHENIKLNPVVSSNIEAIGHNPDTNTLLVQFKNGDTYKYTPVTEEAYIELFNAPSTGKWFNEYIRGNEHIEFERT